MDNDNYKLLIFGVMFLLLICFTCSNCIVCNSITRTETQPQEHDKLLQELPPTYNDSIIIDIDLD